MSEQNSFRDKFNFAMESLRMGGRFGLRESVKLEYLVPQDSKDPASENDTSDVLLVGKDSTETSIN
ncbi:MAG TPA: hypothetical protein VLF63_01730 [Patescibacteria group bacterium]|nr:hypothetical protein [Patescibacteria group bacterium]